MLSAGRCSELRDVGKPERLLNLSDVRYGIVESVFAEGSMFDVFELVAHLAKLPFREGVLPGGKDDRVLASRVVLYIRTNVSNARAKRSASLPPIEPFPAIFRI